MVDSEHHEFDPEQDLVQFRLDVSVAPQFHSKDRVIHLEDLENSKFYRIGYEEYVFLSYLDGKTSHAAALAMSAQKLGSDALSEEQAKQLLRWLVRNDLGLTTRRNSLSERRQSLLETFNPFWLKIPMGNPGGLLKALESLFAPLFTPLGMFATLILHFVAIGVLLAKWDTFIASSGQILSPANWIYLSIAWIALKAAHEAGHGLVSRKFGAEVSSAGIAFVLFAPLPYVDVTSSWKLESKWKRMGVAFGGIYVELMIAAICLIGWSFVRSPFFASQLINVVLMATVTTFLFNINPLMRFDGYYILSDLLGIPNLYTRSSDAVKRWCNWLFYGIREKRTCREVGAAPKTILLYGTAAAIWKVMICVGLFICASMMFQGAGIMIAMFGVFLWLVKPCINLASGWFKRLRTKPASAIRAIGVTSVLIMTAIGAWLKAPAMFATRVSAVVQLDEESLLRAEADGFVEKIFVNDGTQVHAGEPLFQLRNDELQIDLQELDAEFKMAAIKRRIAIEKNLPGETQIATLVMQTIEKRIADKQQQVEKLLVCAARDGQFSCRHANSLSGRFIESGEVLCSIIDNQSKRIAIAIPAEQSIGDLVNCSVSVELTNRKRFNGFVSQVEPQASSRPKYPELIASNGGQIEVQKSGESSIDGDASYRYCTPHFHGIIKIDEATATRLKAGETGHVVLTNAKHRTLGTQVFQQFNRWYKKQVD